MKNIPAWLLAIGVAILSFMGGAMAQFQSESQDKFLSGYMLFLCILGALTLLLVMFKERNNKPEANKCTLS